LLGRRSPREACGAVVRAIGDGKRQTRVIDCRGGARIVHFGLGDAPRADEILIRWPSGTAQTLRRLDADRIHTVREPT